MSFLGAQNLTTKDHCQLSSHCGKPEMFDIHHHHCGKQIVRIFLACLLLTLGAAPATAQPQVSRYWTVPTKQQVVETQISFVSDGAKLSGTLYAPQGVKKAPVVIALHGAQAPLRSEPLYRHLREMLPPLGIAVFLYDRRGSGQSEQGRAAPGDFDRLAADAVVAFGVLAQRPDIDSKRMGFWGLSQGGWLTLKAAALEPKAAFAVAISAPMAGADVQMNFAVANLLRVRDHPESVVQRAVAARTAVDDFTRGKLSRAKAVAAEAAIAHEPWYREIYLRGNIDDPVWRQQIESDPLEALDRAHVPTLVLYGQSDPWVPVAPSLTALEKSAARHPNVEVSVIEGADHAMMLGVPPKQQMDLAFAKSAAPTAPAYFAKLSAWLAGRGMTR